MERDSRLSESKAYRRTLENLQIRQKQLGLQDSPPTETVQIIPGTESAGRPLDSILPVYPKSECTTDEVGMKKILFNLYSMLNFRPPKSK